MEVRVRVVDSRKPAQTLHTLDWESILAKLKSMSANEDGLVIVVNQGQPDQIRSRFMTHKEAMEMVTHALEKKRLNLPFFTLQSLI